MVLADRARAFRIAFVCTAASVLGGLLGYAIGIFLFEEIGKPVLEFYGYGPKFAEFQGTYNDWGAWAVFIAGVTPFPYKVITIASGVTALNFAVFMGASVIARGLRFFLLAGLLYWFGPAARTILEKYLGWITLALGVLLAGGFVAEIPDLPGCITEGDSLDEVFKMIEDAKRIWLETALERGKEIPEPQSERKYSGRFVLRVPKNLHRRLSIL